MGVEEAIVLRCCFGFFYSELDVVEGFVERAILKAKKSIEGLEEVST